MGKRSSKRPERTRANKTYPPDMMNVLPSIFMFYSLLRVIYNGDSF
jgi:hypothetical protein